jgi:hypothetical protein
VSVARAPNAHPPNAHPPNAHPPNAHPRMHTPRMNPKSLDRHEPPLASAATCPRRAAAFAGRIDDLMRHELPFTFTTLARSFPRACRCAGFDRLLHDIRTRGRARADRSSSAARRAHPLRHRTPAIDVGAGAVRPCDEPAGVLRRGAGGRPKLDGGAGTGDTDRGIAHLAAGHGSRCRLHRHRLDHRVRAQVRIERYGGIATSHRNTRRSPGASRAPQLRRSRPDPHLGSLLRQPAHRARQLPHRDALRDRRHRPHRQRLPAAHQRRPRA